MASVWRRQPVGRLDGFSLIQHETGEAAWKIARNELFEVPPTAYTLVGDAGSFELAGQDAALTYVDAFVFDGAYNALCNFCLNGGELNGGADTLLYSEQGDVTLSGGAASVLYSRRIAADAVPYSLAGQNAGTLYGRLLGAASAGFVLTGGAATPLRGLRTIADAGSFGLSPTPVSLVYTRIMQSAGTSLALADSDAATLYGRAISPADTGNYAYAGGDAALVKVSGIIFEVTGGGYNLAGGDAQVLRGYLAYGDQGDYQLGTDVESGFVRDYRLHPAAGEYFLASNDARLYIDVFSPLLQRIFYVSKEDRALAVQGENNLPSVTIGLDRLFMVSRESRGFTVPAERGQ